MRILFPTVAAMLVASSVNATTVFDSGTAVTVTTPINDDVIIRSNTDVTLGTGGSVNALTGTAAVFVQDTSSFTVDDGTVGGVGSIAGVIAADSAQVIVNGGTIRGADGGFGAIGVGVLGTFQMTGGAVTGGTGTTNDGGPGAIIAASTPSPDAVAISGGSLTGGDGVTRGGAGLEMRDVGATVTGGSFQGGDATDPASTGAAGSSVDGSSSLAIFDGFFKGGDNLGSSGEGGAGLRLTDTTKAEIYGGVFEGGTGGFLDGSAIEADGTAMLTLFGGDIRTTIDLSQDSMLTVVGYNLAVSNGIVSGFYRDRTPISFNVTLGGNAKVILQEVAPVPLPASAALALAGIGALAGLRRRKLSAAPAVG